MTPKPLLRGLVLAAWMVLFFSHVAWWTVLGPENPAPGVMLAVLFAGPLLLVLPGLLADGPRAYTLFNLLLLPYFCVAVAALYAAGGSHPVAWMQSVATVGAFIAGFYRTRPSKP